MRPTIKELMGISRNEWACGALRFATDGAERFACNVTMRDGVLHVCGFLGDGEHFARAFAWRDRRNAFRLLVGRAKP